MCYYRFYIFLGCGHHTFSETPVRYCEHAKTKASAESRTCSNQKEVNVTQVPVEGSVRSDGIAHADEESSLLDDESAGRPECSIAGLPRSSHTIEHTDTVKIKATEPTAPVTVKPCGEGRVYPLHTFKLEHICPVCANERDERLRKLDGAVDKVTFDSVKWHWRYRGDHKGKDRSGETKADTGWSVGAA